MMRLNKYIAEQGLASRRGADTLIEEGKVLVNGKIAALGTQVDPLVDEITISEAAIAQREEEKVYFLLNKPEGVITSTKRANPEDIIITDLFADAEIPRIYPVGRLDKDSCGLIMLTNDGDITYKLMHPSFAHEKEYLVEIFNPISAEMLRMLRRPFYMLGQKTLGARVQKVSDYAFTIVLTEGKNRQIRRMVRSVGSGVRTLTRIRIGKITMPDSLRSGEWIQITKEEAYKTLETVA